MPARCPAHLGATATTVAAAASRLHTCVLALGLVEACQACQAMVIWQTPGASGKGSREQNAKGTPLCQDGRVCMPGMDKSSCGHA